MEQGHPSNAASDALQAHDGNAALDAALLVVVSLTLSLTYTAGLGFYLDDWIFQKALTQSPDQSLTGLASVLWQMPNLAVRPVQIAWYVAMHRLAPGNALVPHLANQLVFAAAGAVLYHALRQTRLLRTSAFPLALIALSLPHSVTARLWYANHQAGLALLFFTLTLLFVSHLLNKRDRGGGWCGAGAALCAALSMLSYGLFMGALMAGPVLVMLANGGSLREALRDRRTLAATAAIAFAVLASVAYKLGIQIGVADTALPQVARRVGWLYARAGVTDFWTDGIYLPRVAAQIAGGPFFEPVSLLPPVVAVAAYALRERVRAGREWASAPFASPALRPVPVGLAGLALFVAGYAPYWVNDEYGGTPFGIANRGNIAGALGAGLVFFAALLLLRGRPIVAKGLVALACALGLFVQATIGRAWGGAWREEQNLFAAIEKAAAPFQPGDTILVYGQCPFYGPAPVFPTGYGFGERLELDTGERPLTGRLLTPELEFAEDGVRAPAGSWEPLYRYGPLRVIDRATGTVVAIRSAGDARRFLASHPRESWAPCRYFRLNGTPFGSAPASRR